MDMPPIRHLTRPDGQTLAWRWREGQGPTVIWMGGFRSDMEGTKAMALDQAAVDGGWSYVRYDHFAHGQSSGVWTEATIGRWREDALALIDAIDGPVVPVGSSMGGWIALLAALARPQRMAGLMLVNPAQDFTETLMWPKLPAAIRGTIEQQGIADMPDEGTGPYRLTRAFFDDGRRWMLANQPSSISCPVHILQGRRDDVVPWRHQLALIERLEGEVTLELSAQGDHRLNGPEDLARLTRAVARLRQDA